MYLIEYTTPNNPIPKYKLVYAESEESAMQKVKDEYWYLTGISVQSATIK